MIAPDTERVAIDNGRPGPSLGDELVFAGPLQTRAGVTVGRLDGKCTTTSNPAGRDERRQLCIVTATFEEQDGAELELQGVGRLLAEDVILAVTGGSRRYGNARGEATFDYRTAGQATISFRLIP